MKLNPQELKSIKNTIKLKLKFNFDLRKLRGGYRGEKMQMLYISRSLMITYTNKRINSSFRKLKLIFKEKTKYFMLNN